MAATASATAEKKESTKKWLKDLLTQFKGQNGIQMLTLGGMWFAEVYKCLMGTLLVFFVPNLCDKEDACSEKVLSFKTTVELANYVTLASFLLLYIVEARREYSFILFLEHNIAKPADSKSVESALSLLPDKCRIECSVIDLYYKHIGNVCISFFIFNVILSAWFSLTNMVEDGRTLSTLVTNVLFLASKLFHVYFVTRQKKHVYLSAYMKQDVQYNDVDPGVALYVNKQG